MRLILHNVPKCHLKLKIQKHLEKIQNFIMETAFKCILHRTMDMRHSLSLLNRLFQISFTWYRCVEGVGLWVVWICTDLSNFTWWSKYVFCALDFPIPCKKPGLVGTVGCLQFCSDSILKRCQVVRPVTNAVISIISASALFIWEVA